MAWKSRIKLSLFALLGAAAAVVAYKKATMPSPDAALQAAPMADGTAPQREWTPAKRPGGMEQALQKVMPVSNSDPSEPEPLVQSDLSLPKELPLIKLNSEGDGKIVPTAAEAPAPLVSEPKGTTQPAGHYLERAPQNFPKEPNVLFQRELEQQEENAAVKPPKDQAPGIVVPDVVPAKEKGSPAIVVPDIVVPKAIEEPPVIVPDVAMPKTEEKAPIVVPDLAAPKPEEKPPIVVPDVVAPKVEEKAPLVVPDVAKPKEEEKVPLGIPDLAPPPIVVPEVKKDAPAPLPMPEDVKPLPREVKTQEDTKLPQPPGETTMMGIKTAMTAVLGAAIITAPPPAAPAQDADKSIERLEAAVKRLESIEKSLTDYKASNSAAVRQVQDDVEVLKSRLRMMEEDIRQMRQAAAAVPSVSKRDTSGDALQRTARIKLTNDYNEAMSVIINNDSYRLLPGQSRTISVPPGTFTYQVLELQTAPQVRSISADEEKPIRIYTRQ